MCLILFFLIKKYIMYFYNVEIRVRGYSECIVGNHASPVLGLHLFVLVETYRNGSAVCTFSLCGGQAFAISCSTGIYNALK